MTTPSLPPGKRRFVTRYRVIVSVLLAGAAAALYVGFTSSVDHKSEPTAAGAVSSVKPTSDSNALRQDRIVAALQPSYTGVLIVDGTRIPEDQTDYREGLNVVAYTPGPGTATGLLPPGRRCAIISYWLARGQTEADAQNYEWCWNVN